VWASQARANSGSTEVKASGIHGNGVFATVDIPVVGTLLKQLPMSDPNQAEVTPVVAIPEFQVNHSCEPNAYLDRNRAIRTLRSVASGEEITINYAYACTDGEMTNLSAASTACACGAASCKGSTYFSWKSYDKAAALNCLATFPLVRELEDEIRAEFSIPASESVAV
jgi:hypothetical protein